MSDRSTERFYFQLHPFYELFDLFLDIVCDREGFFRSHRQPTNFQDVAHREATLLLGIRRLKELCLIRGSAQRPEDISLEDEGRNYLRRISKDNILGIPLPKMHLWCEGDMNWIVLLQGIDSPLAGLTKDKWRKLGLCESSGHTSSRGCLLLRRLCRDHPVETISHFLTHTSRISLDDYEVNKNQWCANYLARHIDYSVWAATLTKLRNEIRVPPIGIEDDRKRKIFLQLTGALKKL